MSDHASSPLLKHDEAEDNNGEGSCGAYRMRGVGVGIGLGSAVQDRPGGWGVSIYNGDGGGAGRECDGSMVV